jgi:RNA polymerase primary sigma factor
MREFKISERLTMRTRGIDRYLSEVSKIPMITHDEEEAIALRSVSGDIEARNLLVRSNLRFVVSVAKMYHNGNTSKFEDLINEGNQGLIEAAEQFDTTTGFKFISFAVWHIRKHMLKYLSDNSRSIRIPLNKVTLLNKLRTIESSLTADLDRPPSVDELLEEYSNIKFNESGNITKIKDIKLAMESEHVSPLEGKTRDRIGEFSYSPIDLINGDVEGADYNTESESNTELIMNILDILSPRDRDIVIMHHGFNTEQDGMTYKEIATRLECSAERIRQRYKASIRKLRRRLSEANISVDMFF